MRSRIAVASKKHLFVENFCTIYRRVREKAKFNPVCFSPTAVSSYDRHPNIIKQIGANLRNISIADVAIPVMLHAGYNRVGLRGVGYNNAHKIKRSIQRGESSDTISSGNPLKIITL